MHLEKINFKDIFIPCIKFNGVDSEGNESKDLRACPEYFFDLIFNTSENEFNCLEAAHIDNKIYCYINTGYETLTQMWEENKIDDIKSLILEANDMFEQIN